jgi:LysR family nitrogen assimilation transcriptional regulator
MDLRQLEYFVHVADAGSFSRAAELLAVAQPALSRQIRTLEVELRQTLFLRNGRGVTLTPPGGRLLAHARGILQQVQSARADLDESRTAPVGRVAVGLPPTVAFTVPLAEMARDHTGNFIACSSATSRQPASMTSPFAPRARYDVASSSPNNPSVFSADSATITTSPGRIISAATWSIQLSPGCASTVTAVPHAFAPG